MASYSRSETSDITTCSICFETFKCPKSLPCLHSFCKACIARYFTTVINKGQGQGDKTPIECPICRKEIEKPANVGTSEEWADQLPTNHLLVSMMDMASISEKMKVCASCELESKTESATSWCIKCRKALCETCERKHALFTNSAEHKVVNVQDINKADPQLFACDIPCPRHPEKKIEAYCFDHSTPCCVSCVMINHRKCDKVDNADTAANELRSTNIYEEMKKDFDAITLRTAELAEANKENTEAFQRKVEEIRNEIKDLRQKINEHFDILEKNITQELASQEKEHIPKMKCDSDSLQGEIKSVQNAVAVLSACTEFASNEQLLVETGRLRAQRDEMTAILKKNEKSIKRIELEFEQNAELAKFIETVKDLGKVRTRERKLIYITEVVDFLSAEPELVGTINVQTSSSNITGCCMLDSERLLVATFNGQSVDLYHISGTFLSTLRLSGSVWGVDMINNTFGACTLFTGKQVVLFEITNNTLSLKQSVNVPNIDKAYGILYNEGKLYMGSNNKIMILDITGKVLGDIPQPGIGEIRHLECSEDKYICYTNYSKMFCISLDGSSYFTYSSPELERPEGIGTDSSGNIYVIGQRSRNVHQLTADGKFHRILLKNVTTGSINSLHFCRRLNKLMFNTGRTVHVYEMKNKK